MKEEEFVGKGRDKTQLRAEEASSWSKNIEPKAGKKKQLQKAATEKGEHCKKS